MNQVFAQIILTYTDDPGDTWIAAAADKDLNYIKIKGLTLHEHGPTPEEAVDRLLEIARDEKYELVTIDKVL